MLMMPPPLLLTQLLHLAVAAAYASVVCKELNGEVMMVTSARV